MQYFYINKDSVLPYLRMELIHDGKYDFMKNNRFNMSVQNADIVFSMWDEDGNLRISEAPCDLVLSEEGGCEDRYIIQYRWKKRDTREKGQFRGQFKITFNGGVSQEGTTFPEGDLIMPIYEDLTIMIK